MLNWLFKLHKRVYGFPCRKQVRIAIAEKKLTSLKYRVAMLYVCGYNTKEVAESTGISEATVKETLNIICL